MVSAEGQKKILQKIHDTPLDVSVIVMEKKIQIGELASLTPGSLLQFDIPTTEPAQLHINGRAVAEGQVVQIRDNFGLQIKKVKE